jgi:hypothetical protein
VHVAEDGAAVLVDVDPAVGEVDLAGARRLDLGAGQRDAGLEALVDRIFVKGFAVVGYDGGNPRAPLDDHVHII